MDLRPAKQIENQPWMQTSQAQKIFGVLQGNIPEEEPQALFVGGCVRNALMGRDVEDIDIATVLAPEIVTALLEKNGVKVIPTGIDHGTVTAVCDDRVFEITTLRRDDETDGRRAVVSFTQDWIEDAKRRDFTMNTLLADCSGHIYDPLGQGVDDLEAGQIRFVGVAAKRIEEDCLRILRFFRFHALYGQGNFDQEALQACEKAADKIAELSRERISQEFFKIMISDKPVEILDVMFAHGVLKGFDFENYDADFLKHFCMFQSRYGLTALPARVFVMAGLNFENIKAMENYVIFPKVFLKDMQAIDGVLTLEDLSCEQAVKVSIYKYGRSLTAQGLMIELAGDRVMNGYAPTALEIVQNWDIPMFPLSGTDLQEAGITPGPAMGETLSRIESWWIEQGFKPDRDQCLRQV